MPATGGSSRPGPFAVFKGPYGLTRMRFYTGARNRVPMMLAGCADNLRRAIAVPAAAPT
jgi:hypothetical protein